MKRVLVAGATGYLGRYVVEALKRQGYYTKVLVRDPNKLNQTGEFQAPSINKYADDIVVADLTKPDTLTHVCNNVDYVFSSVGITSQNSGFSFDDIDYRGNLNLLKVAEESNVIKFMYIHACIDDSWKNGALIDAKNRFVKDLTASNLDHIIIRPTGFFSDLSQFFNMAKKGRAYLIGNGKMKMNPIHGEDLAKFCVQSLIEKNKTLSVGGPEVFTYKQIVQLAFDILEKKERVTYIPPSLLKPISAGLKLFSTQYGGLFQFFVNVMTHNIIAPAYGQHTLADFFTKQK